MVKKYKFLLLDRKIYKTGQTRGANDDVIFQNRVGRNSTVLIPFDYYATCRVAPDNNGVFENGFIVLIKPELYFENPETKDCMKTSNLVLGVNSLLFYETRDQWNNYNPENLGLKVPSSRLNPLGGEYVARVPSTISQNDEKIIRGYDISRLKGAGIRIYEYASSTIINDCRLQLEYLYWNCVDSLEVSEIAGMTQEQAIQKKTATQLICKEKGLANHDELIKARIVDSDNNTICPLCLKKLSSHGFLNRLEQAEGRDVPDLTATQISLFHIRELRIGEYNHRPYNLGWGHHHCNVVCKDAGIEDTLKWMRSVLDKNSE